MFNPTPVVYAAICSNTDADHFCCSYSTMVTRSTAAHFAFCFLVVMLAFWSYASMAAHFAFCFLYIYIVLLFGAASEDKVRFPVSRTGLSTPPPHPHQPHLVSL